MFVWPSANVFPKDARAGAFTFVRLTSTSVGPTSTLCSRPRERKRNPAGTIDHFAIGVNPFNKDAVIRDLKQRGATPREEGDAGLHVKDPDGFAVQVLASEQG